MEKVEVKKEVGMVIAQFTTTLNLLNSADKRCFINYKGEDLRPLNKYAVATGDILKKLITEYESI